MHIARYNKQRQQEPAANQHEVNAYRYRQQEAGQAEPEDVLRLQRGSGQKTTAAAEWRPSGLQVDAAFVIVVVVEDIDADVTQEQADESQDSVAKMKGTVIPGNEVPRKASTTESNKNCGLVSRNHIFSFTRF